MATMTLTPSTAAPGTTVTASGTATHKTSNRIYVDGVLRVSFSLGGPSDYSQTFTAPTGANRVVPVVLQQLLNNAWTQVASANLTIQATAPPDITAPIVSGLAVTNLAQTSVTVNWSTNEAANGQIQYGPTTSYGSTTTLQASYTTAHTQNITGLSAGSTYYFRVVSKDAAGNAGYGPSSFMTPAPAGPLISNLAVSAITATSAQVSWNVSQGATGQVEYGLTTAYGSTTTADNNLLLAHSQTVPSSGSLTAGTVYYFRVKSTNGAGQTAYASSSFQTSPPVPPPDPFPIISHLIVPAKDQTSLTVSWDLSEPATGQVFVGLTTACTPFTSVAETSLNYSSHSQTVSGLTAGTWYYFLVKSTDSAGQTTTSAVQGPTQTTAATPPPVNYPLDQPVTYRSTPAASLPAYLTPITDPSWGTRIVRVSNTPGVRGAYSRRQPWNLDGTRLALPFTGGLQSGHMLDGNTYADLGVFSFPRMATWSNIDSTLMYGVTGNQLISKTTAGATTVVHTFSGYSSISLGEEEGGISDDDKYFALIGNFGSSPHLITYRRDTDQVVADIVAPSGIGDCQMSRLGNYVTVGCSAGTVRYLQNLTSPITLFPRANHCDNALDAAGNEILVGNAVSNTATEVASFRLSTGAKTVLFTNSAFEYGHTSGHHSRPGWIYLSNYDESATVNRSGCDQVVAAKIDSPGTVEVFAFAHHIQQTADDNKRYACEPHAAASRDGSRVLFASNWGDSSRYPYAFIASAT